MDDGLLSDLSHLLERDYGLKLEECSSIALESRNQCFSIVANSKHFHLKKFLVPKQKSLLERSLLISEQLSREGIPAPRIHRTKSDQALAESHGFNYLITDWQEGQSPTIGDVSVPSACSAGNISARLHALLLKGGVHNRPVRWTPWHEIREKICCLWDRWQGLDWQDFFTIEEAHLLERHMPLLDHLEVGPSQTNTLFGSLFGDLWLGQFLFNSNSEVVAVVDWEHAGDLGVLADELAQCLFCSFMYATGELNIEAVKAFIAAYQKVFPLKGKEWQTIWTRVLVGAHEHISFHLSAWLNESPSTKNDSWKHRFLMRHRHLLWLAENQQSVYADVYKQV